MRDSHPDYEQYEDAAPLDWDALRKFEGDIDLGFNATGIVRSTVHFVDGEMIVQETMPARYVQEIFDDVARLAAAARNRKAGGYIKGCIPYPIYWGWRREWEKGPRQWGMVWRAFLTSKIEDRDWSKFLVRK